METKYIENSITSEFGDLFAYNLSINFLTRQTEMYFGEHISKNSKPIKKMVFEDVVWQEFSSFSFCNIFNTIEFDNDFEVFRRKHIKYFEKMKNYILQTELEEIKASGNKFYSFRPTAGFDCFIITKSELIIHLID